VDDDATLLAVLTAALDPMLAPNTLDRRRHETELALDLPDRVGDVAARFIAWIARVMVAGEAGEVGDIDTLDTALVEMQTIADQTGLPYQRFVVLMCRGEQHLVAGRTSAATDDANALLDVGTGPAATRRRPSTLPDPAARRHLPTTACRASSSPARRDTRSPDHGGMGAGDRDIAAHRDTTNDDGNPRPSSLESPVDDSHEPVYRSGADADGRDDASAKVEWTFASSRTLPEVRRCGQGAAGARPAEGS
jgi:hypothetical protein